jgi:predicted transcriptional regulator of viral defense system
MSDRPDHVALFDIGAEQHGYFTAEQARRCGFSREALRHHAASGRFIRVHRGLYRLRDYPSSPYDEITAAWLGVGRDVAVVSHETALDLLELSDVIPSAIHLTVPRARRYARPAPGIVLHTTTMPPGGKDITMRHGIRLTSPTRTILDAAEHGTGPEQIEMAIEQAIQRQLIDPDRLSREAARYSHRVEELVHGTLGK